MSTFLEQHADKVLGALSCFDRVLIRGYLPLESGWTMAKFLRAKGVDRMNLKPFLLHQAYRLKKHSFRLAKEAGRPCQCLTGHARKDELAQEIARRRSGKSRELTEHASSVLRLLCCLGS
jgi:hypothetical protein